MKILLVMPTPYERGRLGLESVVWLSEPVALTAIAAAAGEEHEIELLDMRLETEETLPTRLAAMRPDIVGTTSMTTDVYQARAVLRMARAIVPTALTVVGGHAATLQPEEFDDDTIDVVVQGEGELTFAQLVAAWSDQRATDNRTFPAIRGLRYWHSGTRVATPKVEQTGERDTLPAPRRDLVTKYRGRYFFTVPRPMASIFTSHGVLLRPQLLRDLGVLRTSHALPLGGSQRARPSGSRSST